MDKHHLRAIFLSLIERGKPLGLPLDIVEYPELRGTENSLKELSGGSGLVTLEAMSRYYGSEISWTIPVPRGLAQEASAMAVVKDGNGEVKYLSIGDSSNPGHLYIIDPSSGNVLPFELPIMRSKIDWEAISLVEDTPEFIKIMLINNKGSSKETSRKNPGLLFVKIDKGSKDGFRSAKEAGVQKLPKIIGRPRDEITDSKLAARFTCEAMASSQNGEAVAYVIKRKRINVKKKKSSLEDYLQETFDNQRTWEMSLGQIYLGESMEAGRSEVLMKGWLYEKAHRYLGRKCGWANVPTDACHFEKSLYVLCHDEKSHPMIVKLNEDLMVTDIYEIGEGYIKPEGMFVSADGIYLADEGSGERGDEFDNGSKSFFAHFSWDYINSRRGREQRLAQGDPSSIDSLNGTAQILEAIAAAVEYLTDADYLKVVSTAGYIARENVDADLTVYQEVYDRHELMVGHLNSLSSRLVESLCASDHGSEAEKYISGIKAFIHRMEAFIHGYPQMVKGNSEKFEKVLSEKDRSEKPKELLSLIYDMSILEIEIKVLGDLGMAERGPELFGDTTMNLIRGKIYGDWEETIGLINREWSKTETVLHKESR